MNWAAALGSLRVGNRVSRIDWKRSHAVKISGDLSDITSLRLEMLSYIGECPLGTYQLTADDENARDWYTLA